MTLPELACTVLSLEAIEAALANKNPQGLGISAVLCVSAAGRPEETLAGRRLAVQRRLFDDGLVAIGELIGTDHIVATYLAAPLLKSAEALGACHRGHVTMTTLGTNGRFANQLFQYAYLKLYALGHGLAVGVPNWIGASTYGLEEPELPAVPLPTLRFFAFDDDDRELWRMEDPPIDVDFFGYFQEIPECWSRQRSLLRRLFTPNPQITTAIQAVHDRLTSGGTRDLIAIHVRRGDYVELSSRLACPLGMVSAMADNGLVVASQSGALRCNRRRSRYCRGLLAVRSCHHGNRSRGRPDK